MMTKIPLAAFFGQPLRSYVRMYASDFIFLAVASYLIGSIPFGVVLAKLFRLPDPRTIGSGNIGATNMLRTGNKKIAALTLLLDAGKGVIAVLFAQQYYTLMHPWDGILDSESWFLTLHYAPIAASLGFLAALLGHCFTPWLKFKGGKGVATALGGAWTLHWTIGLAFSLVWLGVFLITRYVSLASIAGLLVIPLTALCLFKNGQFIAFHLNLWSDGLLAFATVIGIWRHKTNLARLRAGTEPKIGRNMDA